MRILRLLFVVLALFSFPERVQSADGADDEPGGDNPEWKGDQDQGDEQGQAEAGDQSEQVQGYSKNNKRNYNDNSNNNNNRKDKNKNQNQAAYTSKVQVCADAVIMVEDAWIVCDSPGTFYYGSGKYRNSQSCLPGDKAKIVVDFYIADHYTIQQAGSSAYITIEANGGWWQEKRTVYENADLCSLPTLSSRGSSQCPYEGKYRIKTHFNWQKQNNNNKQNAFEPTVTVGFKSSLSQNNYDYGGANTNNCRGSTFVTWKEGLRVTYANALSNFMKSFGILLSTILIMGLFMWFLTKRPTSLKDAKAKILGKAKEENSIAEDFNFRKIAVEEEFDFKKKRRALNLDQDIVDF